MLLILRNFKKYFFDVVASNVFHALFGKVLSVFSTFLIAGILTRNLSTEVAGKYFYIFSLSQVMGGVVLLGLNQAAMKFIPSFVARDLKSEAVFLICKILLITFLFYCIFLVAGWLFYRDLDDRLGLNFLPYGPSVLMIWIGLLAAQVLGSDILRGYGRNNEATYLNGVLASAIQLGYLALVKEIDCADFIVVTLCSLVFQNIICGFCLKKYFREFSSPMAKDYPNLGELIFVAIPMWATTLGGYLINQVVIWVVEYRYSSNDVAIYATALRASGVFLFVSGVLYSTFPAVISLYKARNDLQSLQNKLQAAATVNSIIMFFPMFLIILCPDKVMAFFYGEKYSQGGEVLMVLSIGYYFNVFTGVRGQVLMMTGYEKLQFVISLFSGVTAILAILFYPENNLLCIAWIVTLITIVSCFLELICVKKCVGINVVSSIKSLVYLRELKNL